MAYTNMTVLDSDIDGDELIALGTAGNAGGTSGFEFNNDGRVQLLVLDQLAAGAGDTITFELVADKFGRNEATAARTVTGKKIFVYGPFEPGLWNKTGGKVRFDLTTKAATTTLWAIRCANPQ